MECDSYDLDFSETPPHGRAFITTERDGYEKLQDLFVGESGRHRPHGVSVTCRRVAIHP